MMKKMTGNTRLRTWLVRWLYLVGAVHVIGAVCMTWFADTILFRGYHHQTLINLGLPEALELQQWWVQLFGATLQAFSMFMLLLIYAGDRQRSPLIWGAVSATLTCWAPQDIIISLQKNIWSHLWVDLAALAVLLPPLIALAIIDKRTGKQE
jgi:hypothetical protein